MYVLFLKMVEGRKWAGRASKMDLQERSSRGQLAQLAQRETKGQPDPK